MGRGEERFTDGCYMKPRRGNAGKKIMRRQEVNQDQRNEVEELAKKRFRQYGFDPEDLSLTNVLVYEFLLEKASEELGYE